MPLNDLSLEELTAMSETAEALCRVGCDLVASGITPVFDLSPGQAVIIRLDVVMPEAPGQATLADVARIEAKLDQRIAASERRTWRDDPESDEAWCAGNQYVLDRLCNILRVDPDAVHWDGSDGSLDEEVDALLVRIIGAKDDADANLTPSPEAAPDEPGEAVPPVPAPAPEETPPAVVQDAGGTLSYDQEDDIDERAFASAEPCSRSDDAAAPPPAVAEASPPPLAEAASSEGAAESGGGQAVAAADPPPAPKDTIQNSFGQTMWTAEEDERLVDHVASAVCGLGLSKTAAIRSAAKELGRPEPGTAFRCHHKLKDRIALAILSRTLPPGEPTPSPDSSALDALSEAVANRVDFVVADGTEAILPPELDARSRDTAIAHGNGPASGDPLQAHIARLPRKDGWTLERDVEFLELKGLGWNENEIALEMKVQAKLLRPRLDLLTGASVDDKGKLQRRFNTVTVFAALQARLKTKAA